jgi:hypothetical protein
MYKRKFAGKDWGRHEINLSISACILPENVPHKHEYNSLIHSSIHVFIHSFSTLSYDRSIASCKASFPRSEIHCFLLQFPVSSPFIKVTQELINGLAKLGFTNPAVSIYFPERTHAHVSHSLLWTTACSYNCQLLRMSPCDIRSKCASWSSCQHI